MTTSADELDEVLERFGSTGPEFGPGLSNHGPMAAEALVAMGRAEAVVPWSAWYIGRLATPPDARNRIDDENWREALGNIKRVGDWQAYFAEKIESQPWRELLETWALRLAPGIMAGATHGILRTAHAVRALERGETPQRVRELGLGLAYWAARYQELPGRPRGNGRLSVAAALREVPRIPADDPKPMLIFEAVRAVEGIEFAPVIDLVDVTANVDGFVSDVTRTFVRHYMVNPHARIAFIHTVTAPSALRILAPYLSPETTVELMRYAWQAVSSVYATYGRVRADDVPAVEAAGDADRHDLIERAVGARDEHAIKFTEACLREQAATGDETFLMAAADASKGLRR